jgi:hypothetical protein
MAQALQMAALEPGTLHQQACCVYVYRGCCSTALRLLLLLLLCLQMLSRPIWTPSST